MTCSEPTEAATQAKRDWDETDWLIGAKTYRTASWHTLTRQAARRVETAVETAGTDRGYVAWSGGKDGTCAAAIAAAVIPGIPVVSFRCGLEYPETVAYQEQTAERLGWNWSTVQTGDALQVLIDSGLWDTNATPKFDTARQLFETAIEQPANEATRMHGPLLVWGLRAAESTRRRMMLFARDRNGVIDRSDGVVTCAPCANWQLCDVWAMHRALNIAPNPIYRRLAELGCPPDSRRVDIMIGADGLGNGRMGWLRAGWPTEWARLSAVLPRITEFA